MSNKDNLVSAQQVREMFFYDPNSGIFTRLIGGGNRMAGSTVGSNDMYGYKTVRINIVGKRSGKSYKLHRLAWLYVYGTWPIGDIDHINGDRSDNRISNLRDVSRQTNLQNQRMAKNNKSTGLLGVYPDKNRFTAKISVNNKSVHLGNFNTALEASEAYVDAKRKLHAGCMI